MSDEYWVDPTPNFQKNAWSYVNGFWDSIIRPDGRVGGWTAVGADDYVIVPKGKDVVGGRRHRHHRYHSSPQYWVPPLYYTGVDFSDVAVNSASEDPTDIPDAWEGGWKKKSNVGRHLDMNFHGEVGAVFKNILKPGQSIPIGGELRSKNGRVRLVFQKDRNLVLYGDGKALWNAGSTGRATKVVLQTDGNLVVYAGSSPIWASNTAIGALDLVAQDDGNLVLYSYNPLKAHWSTETAGFKQYESSSVLGDIAGAVGDVIRVAGAPLTATASLLKDIPILGPVLNSVVALDPAQQIGNISSAVGRGERLDQAILAQGRQSLKAIKDVAPYVQAALTFIPGVGTGIAAAIAAGTALAEGRSITDAVVDGLRNAVPGGALGKTAFNAALAIAHGDSISNVALNSVKQTLPPIAQRAVDTAVAAAGGKNVREAVLQAVRSQLPPAAQKALEVGVATAIGRNAQASVARAVATPAVIAKLAARKPPLALKAVQPKSADQAKGFNVATAILAHSAVTPTAMMAVRAKLKPTEQQGFDQGVKAVRNVVMAPMLSTLVRGGIVSRANWKAVGKNDKGSVPGRLVKDGKIVQGYYARA